ncbi:MAG TPA: cbb3-type cytochrome c oxidase subunit I [Rhodocyclaceae bacterium]
MTPVPSGTSIRLARAWLWLGLGALAGGGLLAVLLVLSRTPGIGEDFISRGFFRAALIVHVDLTVAVWFISCAGVVWSLLGEGRGAALVRVALAAVAAGAGMLLLSPFLPGAQPLLNNYLPVLRHPLFEAGLALVLGGFALSAWRALATCLPRRLADEPLKLGAALAALAGLAALAALAAAWLTLPARDDQGYFEALFWGAGHLLQFQHALLTAVAWLWIADCLGGRPAVAPRTLSLFFAVAAAPLAASLVLVAMPAGTPRYVAGFADLMAWGHPAMVPLMLAALATLWRQRAGAHPALVAAGVSLLLFCVGGVLGFLIRGANVVIPAHYHGAIVGVTLAFMGLAFALLPRLGYREVDARPGRLQPLIYGGGQLIHILGLAWSGGYGVARKVAGTDQVLATLPQKLGMAMMGIGGLIATAGGLMFVVLCLRAMRSPARADAGDQQQQGQLQ